MNILLKVVKTAVVALSLGQNARDMETWQTSLIYFSSGRF